MRRSPLAGTLLISALLLTACGGDEVDPKVAYVEQATGVCDEAELREKVLDPFAEVVEQGKAFAGDVEAAGTDQAALLALISQRPSAAAVDTEYLRTYGLPTCADAIEQAG
jgi:hypothetical protein